MFDGVMATTSDEMLAYLKTLAPYDAACLIVEEFMFSEEFYKQAAMKFPRKVAELKFKK